MLITSIRRLTAACRVAVQKRGYNLQLHCMFTEGRWQRESVIEKLDQDIEELKSEMLVDKFVDQNVNYFKKEGWTIDYDQHHDALVYSKTEGQHEVKVLTRVHYHAPQIENIVKVVHLETPSEETKRKTVQIKKQLQNELDMQKKLQNYYVLVGIKKINEPNWLCSDISILEEEESVQMLTAYFSPSPPSFTFSKDLHHGPILSTLPQQLLNILSDLLSDVGLNSKMLINMGIHSTSKVDEINISWLKNMKNLLE